VWQRVVRSDHPQLQLAQDVDGDGVQDLYTDRTTSGVPGTTIVNGRTGLASAGVALGRAMRASIDGVGADFAKITGTQGASVIAIDGRSRATLWSFHEPSFAAYCPFESYATRLTADAKADVIVNSNRYCDRNTSFVLDGATGKLRWSAT
jgi:hypothetical protein